nr:TadE/TadG family type IV pilus assembly protein [Rhizobium sp. FKL33]
MLCGLFRRFFRARGGNFALTAAIVLPVLVGGVGVAFDMATMVNQRTVLQNGLDTASLSSVSALAAKDKTTANVRSYAVDFLVAQLSGQLPSDVVEELKTSTTVTPDKKTVGTKITYTVSMSARITVEMTPLSRLLGIANRKVAARSSTSSVVVGNALSLYLVVDRSGSMSWVTNSVLPTPVSCQNYVDLDDWGYYPDIGFTSPCYLNKIGALKNAASSLFDTIDTIEALDSTNLVTRTGSVTFTDKQQTASNLAWGTTTSRAYINALPAYPSGGTDMSDAMNTAYEALSDAGETTEHANHGNTHVQKFIVLMTDGENTGASNKHKPSLDTKTLTACTKAKDAGITIYTVAFMAPTRGKTLLLSCSGSSSNSYTADNASELISAFEAIAKKVSDRATRLTN